MRGAVRRIVSGNAMRAPFDFHQQHDAKRRDLALHCAPRCREKGIVEPLREFLVRHFGRMARGLTDGNPVLPRAGGPRGGGRIPALQAWRGRAHHPLLTPSTLLIEEIDKCYFSCMFRAWRRKQLPWSWMPTTSCGHAKSRGNPFPKWSGGSSFQVRHRQGG